MGKPKIRFRGYTDDWEQRKVSDIAEIVGGGTPDTSNLEYWDGDIDWYAPAEMGDKIYADGSERKITSLGFQKCSAKMLPADRTILFTSRAGIGKTAILRHSACTNQGFQSLVLKDNIDPYFVYSMSAQLKEKAEAVASGSTFAEISGKMLGNLDIKIPDTLEQLVIGKYFSNLDHLITLHQRKCEETRRLKQYMLQKMFPQDGRCVPEIRFAGFTEDWEQRKLGDLVEIGDIDHRMPETVADGIPYLMTGDFIGTNELNFDNVKMISKEDYCQLSQKIKPEKGDILFARYASVGAARYVDFTREFLISYSCAIIKKSKKINSKYLYHFITSNNAQRQIKLEINTGSQANIGIDSMKNKIVVNMPSAEEQIKIADALSNLDHLITLHQRKLEILKKIKKYFLKKMFAETVLYSGG